jgi:hypothetical protein
MDGTGEWYSATDEIPDAIRSAGVEALHKRLGNVVLISRLNEEFRGIVSGPSILLDNVLYEAAHAGDMIPFEKVGLLQKEIRALRENGPTLSPELLVFLSDMDELIAAALENHNPIAFV